VKIEEFKVVVATMGLYLVVEKTPEDELHQLWARPHSAILLEKWYRDKNGGVSGYIVEEGLGHTKKAAIKNLKEKLLYGNYRKQSVTA
jgi:hypothetical protein